MPKGIEGASHIESKKSIGFIPISGTNKIPQALSRKKNENYGVKVGGKNYIFFHEGRYAKYDIKTGKFESKGNSKDIIRQVRKIEEQERVTQIARAREAKLRADIVQKNKNTIQKTSTKEVVSDDVLFDGLRGLIRKGRQSDIDAHLDRNRSQYSSFVRSNTFQEKLTQAFENPREYALILQLYAKFTLGDTSIVVDGKYGYQTREIALQVSSPEVLEKRREERKKRIESIRNSDSKVLTKQEENTKGIVEKIIISEENEYRYAKVFDLDETTIHSLTRNKEKKKKTPQQLVEAYNSKKKALFDVAKTSAKKGCINYLQQLFKQTINVPGNPENLEKMFDNLDLSKGVASHEQSVDFDVTLDGKPFSMCYNICDGELKYTPLFMKNEGGDLVKGSLSQEKVLIPKGGMPSLISMLTDAKSGAESAAKTEASNRKGVIAGIKSIEKAVPNLETNQNMIANAVAQESCMQSFLDLTGYDLTQKLDKQTYGTSQLYMIHDMFQHTFNQKDIKPVDIYRLKHLIERIKNIKNEYQNATKIVKKNIRNDQFSDQKIKNDKSNILTPNADSTVDRSLSFYNFFSQYIRPNITDPKQPGYRVLDINKIEADLNKAENDRFLSDDILQKTIAINEEKSEKETADDFLEKNWA